MARDAGMTLLERLHHWLDQYDRALRLGHDAEVKRLLRAEDDVFTALCLCEVMGVGNPVQYYTLELYPVLLQRFHDWHRRMGMDRSPIEGIRCC